MIHVFLIPSVARDLLRPVPGLSGLGPSVYFPLALLGVRLPREEEGYL
jgi:hypothetical protein